MKQMLRLILPGALLVLFVAASSLSAANDVKIHINSPDDVVYADAMNTIEIWIENDQPLNAMSLGFALTSTGGPLLWVTPWGQLPRSQPPYVNIEDGASIDIWDMGGWMVRTDLLPGFLHMAGATINPLYKFPPHLTSSPIVSLKLDASQLTPGSEFCVDNVFIPPAGTWMFDAGSGAFSPNFYDCPGCIPGNFDDPPVCFPVVARPWVKGDANGSGAVDISDVVYMIQFIFAGGPTPSPWQAGDANCDFKTNISDCVYLIQYIFAGGSSPC